MTKLIASMAAVSMFVAASLPAFAATTHKSAEAVCKETVKKEHTPASRMDSFMKSCVEKHTQAHIRGGMETSTPSTGTSGGTTTK
jgi:hypothetical protein